MSSLSATASQDTGNTALAMVWMKQGVQLDNLCRDNTWEEEEAGEGWRAGCLKAGAGIDVPSVPSLPSVSPVGGKQIYSLVLASFPF